MKLAWECKYPVRFNMEYDVAKSVVEILLNHGFTAYFAGGFVRDFVLKEDGADIDIATDARPEDIAKIFPKTIAVGAAFWIDGCCKR